MITVRRLLKSWASPPASWPIADSFCASRSACSAWSRAMAAVSSTCHPSAARRCDDSARRSRRRTRAAGCAPGSSCRVGSLPSSRRGRRDRLRAEPSRPQPLAASSTDFVAFSATNVGSRPGSGAVDKRDVVAGDHEPLVLNSITIGQCVRCFGGGHSLGLSMVPPATRVAPAWRRKVHNNPPVTTAAFFYFLDVTILSQLAESSPVMQRSC